MASPNQKSHKTLTLKKIEGKPGPVWYPLEIKSTQTPTPTSSQLLLHPTHFSLNHRDLFLRQHLYPSPSFTTPLLSDACCTVISTDGKSGTNRRVILNPGHGWLSDPRASEKPYAILGGTSTNPLGLAQDFVVVGEDETVPCPEHLSGAEAAALPLTGLTAWRALVTKSEAAEAGKHILVTGIGGGVALMVLSFAVAMGLKVWVSSGDMEKVEKAKTLGAQGGVDYKEKDWDKELKGMLPKGTQYLDAIIDGAGGDIGVKGAKLLKPGGILVSYGMTVGPSFALPMSAVLKNIEVRGSTMGSRQEFRDMAAFVADKKIRPVVSRVVEGSLGDMEAWERLFDDMKAGRQFGKLVFEVKEASKGKEGGSRL